jgi:hypothetical protein
MSNLGYMFTDLQGMHCVVKRISTIDFKLEIEFDESNDTVQVTFKYMANDTVAHTLKLPAQEKVRAGNMCLSQHACFNTSFQLTNCSS